MIPVPHDEHGNKSIACVSNTATMLLAAKISRTTRTMLQQHSKRYDDAKRHQQAEDYHDPERLTRLVAEETSQLERSWSKDVAFINMWRCEQRVEIVGVPY